MDLIEKSGIVLLAAIAFFARFVLATQLDMVTDERVYILGGKIYIPLLAQLNFTSSQWNYNYEHPPFVKLLIGLALTLNHYTGSLLSILLAGRLPSILMGTALVVVLYLCMHRPFGRAVAGIAALCIACSPWMVYFSSLAYLDMTMTALATCAYLLLWPALRRPIFYPLAGICMGLAMASKYTAALVVPGILLFVLYFFLAIRPRLTLEERPPVPWRWWIAAIVLTPLTFLAVDPAIWRSPVALLQRSFQFELTHSVNGHMTFLAGQNFVHVPRWAILFILSAKISAFVTIPAAIFVLVGLVYMAKFHLYDPWMKRGPAATTLDAKTDKQAIEVAKYGFVVIWLLSVVSMLSLLNIVVGTHYHIPAMPSIALAGTLGTAWLLRYKSGTLALFVHKATSSERAESPDPAATPHHARTGWLSLVQIIVLLCVIVGPHLLGLLTNYGAEGYTSEFYHSENSTLQVAYPAYRDAALWLLAHTHGNGSVGLIAKPGTLTGALPWSDFNQDLTGRLHFKEVDPGSSSFSSDYLVWPMHLTQRGQPIPPTWRSNIVHIIYGGATIYCYILARDPSTVSK